MSNFAEKAKRCHELIHEILLKEWDPICIGHVPQARDEYDSYVGHVYRLVARRASRHEIFDYLWWAETQHMGLYGNRQRTEKIAERLVNLMESY